MDKWAGKVAVVTGASAGIGAAILVELAKHGVIAVGLARRKDRIQKIADDNKAYKIHAVECDLMDNNSITKAFEWVESNLGGVDILVNNAGTLRSASLLDQTKPDSDYLLTIETNLTGLLIATRRALKTMINRPAGYIINIGSVAGHVNASPTLVEYGINVYGATKHAVTNLTDMFRLELAAIDNRKIRVSNVSPGGVVTEIFEVAGFTSKDMPYAKEVLQEQTGATPMLEAGDIADAVVYLLSTKPSVNISELIIHPTGEKL